MRKSAYSKFCFHLKADVAGSSPARSLSKCPVAQGQSTDSKQERFVMIWSFNGRISGCLPEDTDSIPVQIATVTPSSSGPGHRDLYPIQLDIKQLSRSGPGHRDLNPEFPDLIPDTRIRNSTGRVPVP